MLDKQVIEVFDLLDDKDINAKKIALLLRDRGADLIKITRYKNNGNNIVEMIEAKEAKQTKEDKEAKKGKEDEINSEAKKEGASLDTPLLEGETDFIEIWIYGSHGAHLASQGLCEGAYCLLPSQTEDIEDLAIMTDGLDAMDGGLDSIPHARTLGIIGRLGGIGARPSVIGMVSDADGAISALASALKLAEMKARGDILAGDVVITTHICPHAPTMPHSPVPFMGSPVDMGVNNAFEVKLEADAILSVDTTKGNNSMAYKGVMISPTVKEGYILKASEDLVYTLGVTSGVGARVFHVATQDITPYSNKLWHLNSIMQPACATHSPVVGVAITSAMAVPGCASGASHLGDVELAARFCVEVAKGYGAGRIAFYDEVEFEQLRRLYGSMTHLLSDPSQTEEIEI